MITIYLIVDSWFTILVLVYYLAIKLLQWFIDSQYDY